MVNKQTDKERLELYYFQIIDLWKRFCEYHSKLYDLTTEEYSHLLSSDITSLEEVIKEKEDLINQIGSLEGIRQDLIDQINSKYTTNNKINSIADLLIFMQVLEEKQEEKFLEKYNLLLIDIISNIQEQNKTNQLFLNKAIHSLQELREDMTGTTSYKTYDSQGQSTRK